MELVSALLRAILGMPGAEDVATITNAAESTWTSVLETLELHRLPPAAGEALVRHGLADRVPEDVRETLVDAHRRTTLTNTVLLHTLARALGALAERDVNPVVWKGVVLADSFYRDPGARWMGDIDLSIESDEVDATTDAFASVGLRRPAALQTQDAVYFEHPSGVMFDVHHRVRLFEGCDPADLTTEIEPQRCPAAAMRVLAPDAMLVHLIVHLDGHLDETGFVLSWLLDIALVLERWGDRIDLDRVATLMPDASYMDLMHRIVGFLRDELGAAIPTPLLEAARSTTPITLAEILRSRRLAEWDLPSLRGWARLGVAGLLGARVAEDRVWPSWSDLVSWPRDTVRRRRGQRPAA